ncbi:uncharacterized protein J8A68_005978 [[Candida] subhashii]|uniref:non-specific serine/threonine protein kinase n=1 Tax=[Candida] subhashii TaxID=561895 RepID=A0A8J5UUA6_9ASCO|nr:uncharacterized protein J8A68_005978 [[Candida] subhashii]KAG7660559.1 hypothetical protein J8A68_005978 [[Candida] subhashii]
MVGTSRFVNDQNQTAQLAAQFNEFYLGITSAQISQIGNYRIIEEIGEGAFGKVYLARHVLLNIKVVLKCGLIDDPNIVREIYYHKQLKHKNIVNLYEVIKTENHLWIVLEYCEGSELYYYIYEKKRLDIPECQNLFLQIVVALKYVHSLNLSHRDLKLENILLADKKRTIIKLTDFGFVREFNPYNRKLLSTICGTTVYMAPELLKNEKYSGFAVDIWSLGIILYAMVYGVLPFDDDDDMKTRTKILHEQPIYSERIPEEVNQLIRKMLNKDPNQRPDLNEILNSSFLIDHHTKYLAQNSKRVATDAESVLSINQHYNCAKRPFESKIERELVKRLQRLNVDIDELQASVFNNEMNTLTAFYELCLTQEYSRKKQKYMREKKRKYYEAKTTLKKSRKRVKSALSLSDQSVLSSQPIERIISSLSLNSLKNSSKTNLSKQANEYRKSMDLDKRIDPPSPKTGSGSTLRLASKDDPPKALFSLPESPQSPTSNSKISSRSRRGSRTISPSSTRVDTSLRRSVSFVPDERRLSTVSSNKSATKKSSSKAHIFNKLQFWKKHKDHDMHEDVISQSSLPLSTIDSAEKPLSMGNHIKQSRSHDILASTSNERIRKPSFSIIDTEKPNIMENPVASPSFEHIQPSSQTGSIDAPRTPPETRLRRTRPSSMISQVSEISRLSQLSTMLSESELDILDETDTMEDDDEDDEMYESSLNMSHDNRISSTGMTPSSSLGATHNKSGNGKKRPGYRRTVSSDTASSTGTNPAMRLKSSLADLPSNSSEDISDQSILVAPIPTKNVLSEEPPTMDLSPLPDFAKMRSMKSVNNNASFFNNLPSPGTTFADQQPYYRTHSPPLGGYKLGNRKPMKPVFENKNESVKQVKRRTNPSPTFFQATSSPSPRVYEETRQVEHWIQSSNYHSNLKPTYEPVIDEEDEGSDM